MLHFLDSMSHIIYTECSSYTLPETNIFAENGWLVQMILSSWVSAYFQGLPRFQAFAKNAKTRKDPMAGGKRYRAT